jgi:methylenetetrahydrofolate dehydrogenase (NADP+)/methenyltetrahydrofolate cyclohydrolase
MVAVLVGGNPASASFLARKAAVAQSLGIAFELVSFSGRELEGDIVRSLTSFAKDPSVGGIILQLPVPAVYGRDALIRAIGTAKDVDNLSGQADVLPPALSTVQAILTSCGKKLSDYGAIRIIGNGFLVGAPIARFCAQSGIPHEVANSKTENIEEFVRGGDLVVTGVGKQSLVNPDWLCDGAGAIDFGFPPDFDQENLMRNGNRLAFYTPTPYGTGPILIAKLFENFYFLNH